MGNKVSDEQVALAYGCWMFHMWSQNFGSYRDIEWAVNMGLLRPFHHPKKLWGFIVKRCIHWHQRRAERRLAGLECDLDLEYSGEDV